MRQRRADRCLQRSLEALNTHRLAEAREALAEAQRLTPEAAGVRELATRLDRLSHLPPAGAQPAGWRRYAAAAALIVGVGTGVLWMSGARSADDGTTPAPQPTVRSEAAPPPAPVPAAAVPHARDAAPPAPSAGSPAITPATPSHAPADMARAPVSSPAPPTASGSRPAGTTGPTVRPTSGSEMGSQATASAAAPARAVPAVSDVARAPAAPAVSSPLPDEPATPATRPATGFSRAGIPPADTAPAPPPTFASPPEPVTPLPAPPGTATSTPAPATAAPPPVTTTAPPATAAVDAATADRLVRAALGRYQNAYSDLDAAAASAVYPSIDRQALANAFNNLASQSVTLGRCDVRVNGAVASADCTGQARWRPKVGSGTQTAPRRWRFELREAGDAWVITRAEVR